MNAHDILDQLRLCPDEKLGINALLEISANMVGANLPLQNLECAGNIREDHLLRITEGMAHALMGDDVHTRYQTISNLFDYMSASLGRMGMETWITADASLQIVEMIGDAASVRFSNPLAMRTCLDYAMSARAKGRDSRIAFATIMSDQARLLSRVLAILDLEEAVTVQVAHGWQRRSVSDFDVEVMMPMFGQVVQNDAEIPERTLASLGLQRGKVGRLLSETLAIADATEMTKGRVILSTTSGAMFRMVGNEVVARDNMLDSGRLQAIMTVPSGVMFTNTGLQSLLVTLVSEVEKPGTVRFADLGHPSAIEKRRRGRIAVAEGASWQALAADPKPVDRTLARDVSIEEIDDNNRVLVPERYLNTGARDRIDALLAKSDVAELEELVEFIRPVSISEDEGGEFALMEAMPSDITADGFIGVPKRTIRVNSGKYNKARNQRLIPGDVLIAVKGTVGSVAMIPEDAPEAGEEAVWTAGQSMMILRAARRGGISALALYEYLSDETVQEYIRSLAGGTAIQSIAMKDLKAFPVPVPDPKTMDEVREGYARRQEILTQIEDLQKQLEDDRAACWPHRELKSGA